MDEKPLAVQVALIQQDVENIKKNVDLIYKGFFYFLSVLTLFIAGAVFKLILK